MVGAPAQGTSSVLRLLLHPSLGTAKMGAGQRHGLGEVADLAVPTIAVDDQATGGLVVPARINDSVHRRHNAPCKVHEWP